MPARLEGNYTLTSERSKILYNTLSQTLGYTDDATDTRTPDLATHRDVSGILYDEFGSLAGQEETSTQKGLTQVDVPEMKDLSSDLLEITGIWAGGEEWKWEEFSGLEKAELLKGKTVSKRNSARRLRSLC